MQADLMTLSALGCHPLGVVTAVTVQDTTGVEEIVAMDDDLVVDQARVLLSDVPVAAFKIGVMGSVENIAAIAEIISDYPHLPVVFDPVLSSGRGDELADGRVVEADGEGFCLGGGRGRRLGQRGLRLMRAGAQNKQRRQRRAAKLFQHLGFPSRVCGSTREHACCGIGGTMRRGWEVVTAPVPPRPP